MTDDPAHRGSRDRRAGRAGASTPSPSTSRARASTTPTTAPRTALARRTPTTARRRRARRPRRASPRATRRRASPTRSPPSRARQQRHPRRATKGQEGRLAAASSRRKPWPPGFSSAETVSPSTHRRGNVRARRRNGRSTRVFAFRGRHQRREDAEQRRRAHVRLDGLGCVPADERRRQEAGDRLSTRLFIDSAELLLTALPRQLVLVGLQRLWRVRARARACLPLMWVLPPRRRRV